MPGSVDRKGREVGNDSRVFVLGIWKEDGAENGNTEEEQVWGERW